MPGPKAEIYVPLEEKHLKPDFDELNGGNLRRIKKSIEQKLQDNPFLSDIISSLLDISSSMGTREKKKSTEAYRGVKYEVVQQGNSLFLHGIGIPQTILPLSGEATPAQKKRLGDLFRDMALATSLYDEGTMTPEQRSSALKDFVLQRAILTNEEGKKTFWWGGHSISTDEYEAAKLLAREDVYNRHRSYITGSGPGIMRAPFSGAMLARRETKYPGRNIGFSEVGITIEEAPNNLVDDLVLFLHIGLRMEAFIRAAQEGRVSPGGTGTMEEIMTFLAMKIHPNNQGMIYPLDLVEQKGGKYMHSLQNYFRDCFGNTLDGNYEVFVGEPQEYVQHAYSRDKKLPPNDSIWNSDLYMPPEIQGYTPAEAENFEELILSKDLEPYQLLVELRKFFSMCVDVMVKNPDKMTEFKKNKPTVQGDKQILDATRKLLKELSKSGRISIADPKAEIPIELKKA